jgi:hypothetical protein
MTTEPGLDTAGRRQKSPLRLLRYGGLAGLGDHNSLWYAFPPPIDYRYTSLVKNAPQLLVCVYLGAQEKEAMSAFEQDASELAQYGYEPTRQDWTAGRWARPAFVVAFLLTIVGVGLLLLPYMLVVKPDGTLEVRYTRQGAARGVRPPGPT